MKKWWLISEEDISAIAGILKTTINRIDDNCAKTGCLCDLRESPCSERYSDILHILESGLHETNFIPRDWNDPE